MSNGGLVHSTRIPLAGNWLDRNIQRHLYEKLDAWISLPDCQRIKHQVGTLGKQPNSEWHASVQDIAGKTVQVDLTGSDLKPAIEKGLEFIVDELRWFFKTLPLDILRIGQQSGMLLSGGCGYVAGISGWLADRLNLPVETADTPDLLVIQGMRDFLPRSAKFFNQVLGWQSRSR